MQPTRLRVPWSELAALTSLVVALFVQRASGRPWTLEGTAVAMLAIVAAIAPRRALESESPAAAEAAAVAGTLASLAIATTVAGRTPPTTLARVVHALATGEVIALATMVALALPLRPDTLRAALVPSSILGLVGALGLWSMVAWVPALPDLRVLCPVAAVVAAVLYAHAVRRPVAPIERARLVAPALGAVALAAAAIIVVAYGRRTSPLVLAAGLTAQVLGLTLGTGAVGLGDAARLARRCAAGVVGIAVGTTFALVFPSLATAGAPIGTLAMLMAWPYAERLLRPDRGRLLDACDEIDVGLRSATTMHALAAAVLDPLRLASRNLRAPAALWVLDRAETLRIDVTGGTTVTPLSLDTERTILSWLRARPGVLFVDTLRPYQVRRAELRAVVAALDEHGAFGAVPLYEEHELSGVLLLPRGARRDAATYEEELRLDDIAQRIAASLSVLAALERAQDRVTRAQRDATEAHLHREAVEAAHRHLVERDAGVRTLRSVGTLDAEWIAYSTPMRDLTARLDALARTDGVLCLVAEPGAGAVAVAKALHERSVVARGPFVVFDASMTGVGDALPALVGDARGAQPRAGWLEHAAGGTLVIHDVAALGHEALVALHDALRTGTARRMGAVEGFTCTLRLVLVSRRPLAELDLPAALVQRVTTTVVVPPLRARAEDIESLALLAIDRACRAQARSLVGITPEALIALRGYAWPGNVQELLDVLDGAVARTRGTRVTLDALPASVRGVVNYAMQSYDVSFDDDERPYDDA